MSLVFIGDVLDVTTREVRPKAGQTWAPFSVTTLHVLSGRSVHKIDLPGVDQGGEPKFRGEVPAIGAQVALQVSVRAYPTNNGTTASYDLTAWENCSDSIRVAAPAKAS
jgi:hypothetical protein